MYSNFSPICDICKEKMRKVDIGEPSYFHFCSKCSRHFRVNPGGKSYYFSSSDNGEKKTYLLPNEED